MRKSGYIVIQEWMTEFELRPSALIAYAVIYGFSQDGKGRFIGGADYIAKRAGTSIDTVRRDLKSLKEKGLIRKFSTRRSGCCTVCEYWAVLPVPTIGNLHTVR